MEPLTKLVLTGFLLVVIMGMTSCKKVAPVQVLYTHPLRNSSLLCYTCHDGDDCINMPNNSKVPVLRCKWKETFCKVRRLHTNGKLTTFDRECVAQCTPGCAQGAIYEECKSCCSTSLCNTDNGSQGRFKTVGHSFIWILFPLLSRLAFD